MLHHHHEEASSKLKTGLGYDSRGQMPATNCVTVHGEY
jgi:hypothetical protein